MLTYINEFFLRLAGVTKNSIYFRSRLLSPVCLCCLIVRLTLRICQQLPEKMAKHRSISQQASTLTRSEKGIILTRSAPAALCSVCKRNDCPTIKNKRVPPPPPHCCLLSSQSEPEGIAPQAGTGNTVPIPPTPGPVETGAMETHEAFLSAEGSGGAGAGTAEEG